MVFQDEQQVIDKIKEFVNPPKWVMDSREEHKKLKALVTGENFTELLITQFEKIESRDRAVARKKYSKDVRDLFNRVYQPRDNVFRASGGSVTDTYTSEANKKKYLEASRNYKGQKTIKQYLADAFFKLADIDPNGLIFTEYVEDTKIYPTYKSINDIRVYESDGQLCEYVIFEPVKVMINNLPKKKWRVVDDKKEYSFIQDGDTFYVDEEGTFDHPFGLVPCVILSANQKTGSELRVSDLFPIVALAEDYAIRKSRYTIYDTQCGFPDRWRYEKTCRTCHGTGKVGDGECPACGGKTRDVTDVNVLETPREDDPILPAMSGFVSPDLAWLLATEETLQKNEDKIDSTVWGTKRISEGGNETATGRFIDVQPVMNKLTTDSNNVEWVYNQLSLYIQSWVANQEIVDNQFYVALGNRFIIESQDVLIDRYSKSRIDGDNVVILDKALDEVLLAKYQNNPASLKEAQKKRVVEPYVHNSIVEVNEIFGSREASKKVLFVQFWEQADKTKEADVLIKEFNTFFEASKLGIPKEETSTQTNN
tara:strand:- start:2065 stop:3678 length:1614 start_codon:yes stop_codon:yes gene_type:complete